MTHAGSRREKLQSLSLPVIFPSLKCKFDVVLLALLRSTAKKDDDLPAFFPKIHSIAWTKIVLALVNASPKTFGVGEREKIQPFPRELLVSLNFDFLEFRLLNPRGNAGRTSKPTEVKGASGDPGRLEPQTC